MKTIIIVTPSNIEVEYRLAGAGARLAAFIVDFALQMSMIGLVAGIVLLGFDRRIFGNVDGSSGVALGIVMLAAFSVHFGYFIVCEMLMYGQSVGKRIFGLRVICDNGRPVELSQAVVRGLLRASVDMLYIGLFVMLFSKKHKRLGDMAAGTIVISEGEKPAPAVSAPEWPGFLPDPHTITPAERGLAEEWLRRRESLPRGGAEAGQKLIEYFKNRRSNEHEKNSRIRLCRGHDEKHEDFGN